MSPTNDLPASSAHTTPIDTKMNTNTGVTSSVQLPASSPSDSPHMASRPVPYIERISPSSTSSSIPPPTASSSRPVSALPASSFTAVTSMNDTEKDTDPYDLRARLLSAEQLAGLRSRTGAGASGSSRGWGSFGGLGRGIVAIDGTRKGRALEAYHVRQNNLIPELLKPIDEHTANAEAEEDATRLPVRIAVHASLYGNIVLCIVQIYAAISSLSLSLISTGIDSVFDVASNVSLFYLHRKAIKMRQDEKKWPVGGARLECIGNIVFGFLMSSVNLVVIVESVRAIITKEGHDLHKFHLASTLAVVASLAVKSVLFLYSYSLRKNSSQVQVLWEDHRNDLVLNGFAIITSTGGSKLVWWLDPAGAILLGLFIIISWGRTIYREFGLLAGKSAPHEFLQLLTYKAATFSEAIERVDTVRAYHSGPNYFVEVDIVMDGASTLYTAHDLSQSLQDKLESLPGVERAFVHVDYETDHTPEHRKRKLA